MKKLLAFLICFGLPAVAKAHEEDQVQGVEYRVLHKITQDEKVQAVVMVREGGHLLGQPYQVELRVNCQGSIEDPTKVEVKDSFSVCDLDPQSLKVNTQKTAVAMKVKMADINHYDEQVSRGVASPEQRCLKKTSVKKFSLRNLCD